MGKSYRKPYATPTGSKDAKQDRICANRAVRRLQNRSLLGVADWEEYLLPHKYEARNNDPWGWERDGKPKLKKPPTLELYLYHKKGRRARTFEETMKDALESFERQKKYYEKLKRK